MKEQFRVKKQMPFFPPVGTVIESNDEEAFILNTDDVDGLAMYFKREIAYLLKNGWIEKHEGPIADKLVDKLYRCLSEGGPRFVSNLTLADELNAVAIKHAKEMVIDVMDNTAKYTTASPYSALFGSREHLKNKIIEAIEKM